MKVLEPKATILDTELQLRLGQLDAVTEAMLEDDSAEQFMLRGLTTEQALNYARGIQWLALKQGLNDSSHDMVRTLAFHEPPPELLAKLSSDIDVAFTLTRNHFLAPTAAKNGRTNQLISLGARIKLALTVIAKIESQN